MKPFVPAVLALLIAGQAQAAEPQLEFAFEEVVTLAADVPVGGTALGGVRSVRIRFYRVK